MKLAICLFKFFPFGGLQRDFLAIAKECRARGHSVDVFTMQWEGPLDPDFRVIILKSPGWSNHARRQAFAKQLQSYLSDYDLTLGFNKMPGLDIYYAADTCFQAKSRAKHLAWYRLTPRYRQTVAAEEAVFRKEAKTVILLLSELAKREYVDYYQTPLNRFYLLPPGIAKDRKAPPDAFQIRKRVRAEWRIQADEFLLLFIGSGFKTKGLDRVLKMLTALPLPLKQKTFLFVIGQDNAKPFKRFAEKAEISAQVTFLGGRDDIPQLLLAGDLLLHPAYNENTGTVLLEALVSGLPVLTTDVCGYAHYISAAKAGRVFSSPFQQEVWNQGVCDALQNEIHRQRMKKCALEFVKEADIFSLKERAVDVIEEVQALKFSTTFSFDEWMSLKGEVFRSVKGRKTQRIFLHNKSYFIKQHEGVGWKEIFKNLLQGRAPVLSAKNEWLALKRLQALNIAVPDVLYYESRGLNPAKRRSFLVTHDLTNTVSLETHCQDWEKNRPSFPWKLKLIQTIATIARSLHQNGINHRDFYLCHFLLDLNSGHDQTLKLYLIDLHRAVCRGKTPKRWLIKDLAGLYFSSKTIGLTDRDLLRFMKIYCNKPLAYILKNEKCFWIKVKKRGEKLFRTDRR